MAYWKHREKSRTDSINEPTEKAFFSNEVVGSISNALTREANQNVLDEVKDDSKPAEVRVFLSGDKYSLEPDVYDGFLNGIKPHLFAKGNGIIPSTLPDFTGRMKFLVYEDFNTKGLEGDTEESEYNTVNDATKQHNFYYFWRSYGQSGKLSGKMGSWGVGKSVFPALSRVNCFWGLTIRQSDNEPYLMGQSVLRTHNRTDFPKPHAYFPYGYFAQFRGDGFAVPESNLDELNFFAKKFRLKRSLNENIRHHNTGLSIIVPFIKDEVSLETISYSTIQQFFYPIVRGKLIVTVGSEDREIELTASTIETVADVLNLDFLGKNQPLFKNRMKSAIKFIRWVIKQNEKDYTTLHAPSAEKAYEWRKKELFSDHDLTHLRNRFSSGEPLAFRIPIKYQPEGREAELRFFKAFIQKDDSLEEPENFFIRDHLTITGIKSLKRKGVRGLVLIDEKDLITMFGQAEGPAHTGWHKDNFKSTYIHGEQCISFVQRSLEALYSILQLEQQGVNKTLLRDMFYVDLEKKEDSGESKDKGDKKPKTNVPDLTPRVNKYTLSKIVGGFKISSKSDSFPEYLKVQVAYLQGDSISRSLRKYSEFDFNLKNLNVQVQSLTVAKCDSNILEFEPLAQDFELTVTGFDKWRDLVVSIK